MHEKSTIDHNLSAEHSHDILITEEIYYDVVYILYLWYYIVLLLLPWLLLFANFFFFFFFANINEWFFFFFFFLPTLMNDSEIHNNFTLFPVCWYFVIQINYTYSMNFGILQIR